MILICEKCKAKAFKTGTGSRYVICLNCATFNDFDYGRDVWCLDCKEDDCLHATKRDIEFRGVRRDIDD